MYQRVVAFDTTVTAVITSWPYWLRTPCILLAVVFQPFVLSVAAIAVFFSLPRATLMLPVAAAAIGANGLLKRCIRRQRPNTPYARRMLIQSPSFPSGHTFATTVMLGVASVAIAPHVGAGSTILVASIAIVWAATVGLSRVYLGAHHPTDIIAGWLLGLLSVWAITAFTP